MLNKLRQVYKGHDTLDDEIKLPDKDEEDKQAQQDLQELYNAGNNA
jgi:hypothetical protein